jgi:hypothetical protein
MNNIQRHNHTWMIVYTAVGAVEAHIVANRLKSEGIFAMIHQEPAAAAFGLTIGMGEIRVLVRAGDYEKAMAVLESTFSTSTDITEYHPDNE